MCGFTVLFERERKFSHRMLSAMGRDLFHRGPDSGGIYTVPGVGMVFRRLAILDKNKKADQPMFDQSRRFTLVYNGEIYNFKSIRSLLIQHGFHFNTAGDTEVLLNGFIHWREKVVDYLEGMYSFVIVDHLTREAFAARDPLGIKPLYVCQDGPLTVFSSEMRPLRHIKSHDIDESALSELLLFRFAAGRVSNLRGIERLPGGTLAKLNLSNNSMKEQKFSDVLDTLTANKSIDKQYAQELVSESIRSSVHDHLISDVGYAIQLSGGLDSSIITALASKDVENKIHSYGINLGDQVHDESMYRQDVASKFPIDHHEVRLDGNAFADALPRAIKHMEGPSPHLGCVLLMLLCDKIRNSSKVVLTGEGADELFGGYSRYGNWHKLRLYEGFAHHLPKSLWPLFKRYNVLRAYERRDLAAFASVLHDYFPLMSMFPDLIPSPGVRENASSRFSNFCDRLMAVDQTSYLESLLLRQDKMAMAASVEARVPFAHFPLVKKINTIPQTIRAPGKVTKPLLKQFALNFFKEDFVNRKKVGLTLPLEKWLADTRGLGRYIDLLQDPNCELLKYTDRHSLVGLISKFRDGNVQVARILTHLINIELWLLSTKSGYSQSDFSDTQ